MSSVCSRLASEASRQLKVPVLCPILSLSVEKRLQKGKKKKKKRSIRREWHALARIPRVAFRRAHRAACCSGLELYPITPLTRMKRRGIIWVTGFSELVDVAELTGVKTTCQTSGGPSCQSYTDPYEGDLWVWGRGGCSISCTICVDMKARDWLGGRWDLCDVA